MPTIIRIYETTAPTGPMPTGSSAHRSQPTCPTRDRGPLPAITYLTLVTERIPELIQILHVRFRHFIRRGRRIRRTPPCVHLVVQQWRRHDQSAGRAGSHMSKGHPESKCILSKTGLRVKSSIRIAEVENANLACKRVQESINRQEISVLGPSPPPRRRKRGGQSVSTFPYPEGYSLEVWQKVKDWGKGPAWLDGHLDANEPWMRELRL